MTSGAHNKVLAQAVLLQIACQAQEVLLQIACQAQGVCLAQVCHSLSYEWCMTMQCVHD